MMIIIIIIIIISGSCVYDRNPGDARVKVGSERKLASSPGRQNSANSSVGEIACFISGLRAEGPSKIGLLIGIFILKKIPISSWDLALHEPNLPMDTRDNERNPRQMMASCLSKLHSDPMFSIALISPLGPHSGSGAVPRTPATPPRSFLHSVSLGCCSALLLLSLLLVWRFRPSVFPFQPLFCRRAPRSRSQKNNLSQG